MNVNAKIAWACGAVLFGSLAASSPMAAPANGDEAAIRALEQHYIEAFNAKDVAKVMSCYVPGSELFVFDVTPPRQHVGWADYRKDWEDLFTAFPGPIHQDMSGLQVHVLGPVAWGHNIQSGWLTRKDGSRLEIVVRVTDVYRKEHGKWLIAQEHVSIPVDIDTRTPDLLSKP